MPRRGPLFWPAFLLIVGDSRAAATAFDADPADVEEYARHLMQPGSWPFLTLPVAAGHRVHLLFRNHDDDTGLDYLLAPAGSTEVVTLAALDGHFIGPGLCWPELITAAGRPDPVLSAAERLLLLLPAMGDVHLPEDAEARVAAALTAVGAAPRGQHDVAAALLAPTHAL